MISVIDTKLLILTHKSVNHSLKSNTKYIPVSSLTGVPDLASSKSSTEDSSPGGPTSEDTLFADLSLSLDMFMPSGPERIVNPTPEKRTVDVGTSGGFPTDPVGR